MGNSECRIRNAESRLIALYRLDEVLSTDYADFRRLECSTPQKRICAWERVDHLAPTGGLTPPRSPGRSEDRPFRLFDPFDLGALRRTVFEDRGDPLPLADAE